MRGSGQKEEEEEDVEEGYLALRVKRRIWTLIVRRASFAWTAKRQKRKRKKEQQIKQKRERMALSISSIWYDGLVLFIFINIGTYCDCGGYD